MNPFEASATGEQLNQRIGKCEPDTTSDAILGLRCMTLATSGLRFKSWSLVIGQCVPSPSPLHGCMTARQRAPGARSTSDTSGDSERAREAGGPGERRIRLTWLWAPAMAQRVGTPREYQMQGQWLHRTPHMACTEPQPRPARYARGVILGWCPSPVLVLLLPMLIMFVKAAAAALFLVILGVLRLLLPLLLCSGLFVAARSCFSASASTLAGETVNLVVDLSQFGRSNVDMDGMKFFAELFTNYYPEVWLRARLPRNTSSSGPGARRFVGRLFLKAFGGSVGQLHVGGIWLCLFSLVHAPKDCLSASHRAVHTRVALSPPPRASLE